MNLELIWLFKALENIALSCCITYAAVSFNKWQLLWFYIVVLLNGVSTTQRVRPVNTEETKNE